MKKLLITIIVLFTVSTFCFANATYFKTNNQKLSYALGMQISKNLTKQKVKLYTKEFTNGYIAEGNGNSKLTKTEMANELNSYGRKTIDQKLNVSRFSYALGMQVSITLEKGSVKINSKYFVSGFIAQVNGKPLLNNSITKKLLASYGVKTSNNTSTNGLSNKLKGIAFLKANAKKKGVVTLPSGLQYKIIVKGKGKKPTINDKVTVNYIGKKINGVIFNNSYTSGKPISFPLNGVIKGWQIGLQQMNVGSTYLFYIPYNLAYGARGAGSMIKPYSALIFKVQLLKIS